MNNVFEEKSVLRAILRLGLPAMLAQLATLIYNTADTYFVSLTKSPAQIAAVTLCTPVLLIIMSIACVFGMGGSSVIARLLGANDKENSKNCFSLCTWATIFAGVLVTLLGMFFLKPIAVAIGTDDSNFTYTCQYLQWIFLGAPFIMLSSGYGHSFRSVAMIKQATTGVIIGNVVNIILDWIFIVPLGMGTAGAALATSIGYVMSSAYYLCSIAKEKRKGNKVISLSLNRLKHLGTLPKSVIQIGIPGALITVMLSISNIVLNSHIAIYGSDAVACYGISYKIFMFPVLLSVGLSQGIAPLVGYCYGAKERDRLLKSTYWGALFGVLLGVFFLLTFLIFSRQLASIFMDEEKLIEQTASFIRVLAISSPMLGIINMVTSYFQALGKAVNSLIITLLRNVILFIPGVMLMNYLWQLDGVIATQPVVEILLAIICAILFLISKKKLLQ